MYKKTAIGIAMVGMVYVGSSYIISSPAGAQTAGGACIAPVMKVTTVGTSAVPCPGTNYSGRKFIALCNSPRNAAGKVTIRIDGVAPTTATASAGDVLSPGDCAGYTIGAAYAPQCISDTAGVAVTSTECQ